MGNFQIVAPSLANCVLSVDELTAYTDEELNIVNKRKTTLETVLLDAGKWEDCEVDNPSVFVVMKGWLNVCVYEVG